MNNSYLCGYLKIKGLTEEFPTLTTFFDGEIISARFPFLTRKWDADEDVDRKHWVSQLVAVVASDVIVNYQTVNTHVPLLDQHCGINDITNLNCCEYSKIFRYKNATVQLLSLPV